MKVPIRTCIICREKKEKNSLMRIVYKNNVLKFDPTGNMPGRGAYICKNHDCPISIKSINRAFKTNFENNQIINLRNDDMAL